MRRHFASLFTLALLTASPAHAVMEDYPSVKLQGLDKSVGRTVTFEAKVGSTIQYGPLYIKIQACRKAPPIEKPESAAFLQIWEVPPGQEKSEWSFSGWMFASSPALSPMDHPVYDVWVLDCLGREEPNEEAAAAETDADADQTSLPAAGAESSEVPVDQEAAPADSPVDPEAVPNAAETQLETPADIPTDTEAETETEPAPQNIIPDPNAPYSPNAYPSPTPQQAPVTQDMQQPEIRPQDPTGDNRTAYDFMDQQGTNAQPAYDPNAPYNPQ